MNTDLQAATWFDRLIALSIARRWLVLLAVLAMAAIGMYNYGRDRKSVV